jgi:hypothetical protein
MLLGLLAAAAVAAQQPQSQASMVEDSDLRCMVAMSFALATIDATIEKDGAKADEEERSGIVALIMYYVGKIDGRTPGFDYAGQVTRLVQTPGYTETGLRDDLTRCGDDAQERGRTLMELGKQLEDLVPLITGKRG